MMDPQKPKGAGLAAERQDEIAIKGELEALENRMKLWMSTALSIFSAAVVTLTKLLDYVRPAIGL